MLKEQGISFEKLVEEMILEITNLHKIYPSGTHALKVYHLLLKKESFL